MLQVQLLSMFGKWGAFWTLWIVKETHTPLSCDQWYQ